MRITGLNPLLTQIKSNSLVLGLRTQIVPLSRCLCHLNPSSINFIKVSGGDCSWTSHIRPKIPVHTNYPEIPGEKDLKCLQAKPDLTLKYRALVDHFRIKTSGSLIDPKGVFANNELDLSEIDVYGFDYDCECWNGS